jgi:hypothetical protein
MVDEFSYFRASVLAVIEIWISVTTPQYTQRLSQEFLFYFLLDQ